MKKDIPLINKQPRSCARCQFRDPSLTFDIPDNIGACRFFPITLSQQIMPQPPRVLGGPSQMGVANMANYPPVRAIDWCYQYKDIDAP